jgi:hypothetical protein
MVPIPGMRGRPSAAHFEAEADIARYWEACLEEGRDGLLGSRGTRASGPLLDEPPELASRGRVGGEHRPELEVERDLRVVVLDLRDARLARAHSLREVLLREAAPLSERANGVAQRELCGPDRRRDA